MRAFNFTSAALMLLLTAQATALSAEFQVIAYHDVRDFVHESVDADQYAISTQYLLDHFRWLDANGFVPISVDDIVAAENGERTLPSNAVLLTFDDGLQSVYSHVFPLLKLFNYPAVVSVVTSWTNGDTTPPANDPNVISYKFLEWPQIREMHESGLVEIASHSHDLHRGVQANPQGNLQPATVTRWYRNDRYERSQEHVARIRADLQRSSALIEQHVGVAPRVMTWPYGAHSQISIDIARELGMPITLTLVSRRNDTSDLSAIGRHLILANPQVERLGLDLLHEDPGPIMRVAQVDLDYIFDTDAARQERNLSQLLDRIKALQISHVFLQAFADPDADGGAQSVYFPNRHLPMRADLFSRVAWQLKTRSDVLVYGWLPILSFAGSSINPEMRVAQLVDGELSVDADSEPRLSVFDQRARKLIKEIYEDLAVHAFIDGILFHDDGRLNEFEDANPAAMEAYRAAFGPEFAIAETHSNPELQRQWAEFKTDAIIDFTRELETTVRIYRPDIKTARNLFASALLDPEGEAYLAQRFTAFADAYDHIALMAMPYFENASDPREFLLRLITEVGKHEHGLQRTIFELQTVDWKTTQPLPAQELRDTMRWLQANGVKHIGYYPDDFILGLPSLPELRTGISLAVFPQGLQR